MLEAQLDVPPPVGAAPPACTTATAASAVSTAMALAACGGGDAAGPAATAQGTARKGTSRPTDAQCARFLGHAAMGISQDLIDDVAERGFENWLDRELGKAPDRLTRWKWLQQNDFTDPRYKDGFDQVTWARMIGSTNTVRQRVTLALSELLVVSIINLPQVTFRANVMASYLDLLEKHAFSSYRDVLEAVSMSPAMAYYLTYNGNRKTDGLSVPDENYARELMQLFSIGLYQLNLDGTLKLNADGQPIETYNQTDVTEMARVFTGWYIDPSPKTMHPENARLSAVQDWHDPDAKKVLGSDIKTRRGGLKAADSLSQALDIICAHSNVAPFISRQLIQRLVTSNPRPAYVERVAREWLASKGSLKRVVRAILLDPEATGDATLSDPAFGKLREPVLRLVGWARAFKVTTCDCGPGRQWLGATSVPTKLNQTAGHSPGVFNFFRPGYVPPHMSDPQPAPEFQITNEASVIGYVNFMQQVVSEQLTGLVPDYDDVLPLARDDARLPDLLNRLNLLLAAGQISQPTLDVMAAALLTAAPGQPRLYAALTMVLAAPEFIVQR